MEKTSAKSSAFYDSWLKSQGDFLKNWTKTAENFQKAFTGMSWTKGAAKDTQDISGIYNLWGETFGKYFDVIIKSYPLNAGTDTSAKLFKGADAYMKLYEFWKPVINALQEKGLDIGSYKDVLDFSNYREVMDKIFGFSSPGAMQEFYGQASHLMETWGSKGQIFVKPWMDLIQKNIDASLDLASGDPEASLNISHNIYSAFESTFGKVFKMPAVGKDREETELWLKVLDRYSIFLSKNVEFQHVMYKTGQKAMDEVMEAVAKKIKEGEDITSFDEFFKLWAKVNEKTFLELFKTEEFSKLQGIVLDVSLDARKHFQQLMELYLSDFPVALRSEMDDAYKTIYNLNKNVRALMKKSAGIDEMQQEITALKEKLDMVEKKSAGIGDLQKEIKDLKRKISSQGNTAKKKTVKEVTK
ncbi:hypothetical protein KKC52_04650 [bacterium]|nr:hypothetical protein [bacterium]